MNLTEATVSTRLHLRLRLAPSQRNLPAAFTPLPHVSRGPSPSSRVMATEESANPPAMSTGHPGGNAFPSRDWEDASVVGRYRRRPHVPLKSHKDEAGMVGISG